MAFGGCFRGKSHISQTIFIVIIAYTVSSIVILCLAVGLFPYLPYARLNPAVCAIYAIISFGLTALISVYHLRTMFRRRKRKSDTMVDASKAA